MQEETYCVRPIQQHLQMASQSDPSGDGGAQKPQKTMKAVRFHGQNDLRVENIPEPQIQDGKVKIKPEWCGICGRVSRRPTLQLVLLMFVSEQQNIQHHHVY